MATKKIGRTSFGIRHPRRLLLGIGAALFLAAAALPRPADAQTTNKTFFNYIEKTPITCPLTGVALILITPPRGCAFAQATA